jgi:F0F1-type ATP synthase epsilon subunit
VTRRGRRAAVRLSDAGLVVLQSGKVLATAWELAYELDVNEARDDIAKAKRALREAERALQSARGALVRLEAEVAT